MIKGVDLKLTMIHHDIALILKKDLFWEILSKVQVECLGANAPQGLTSVILRILEDLRNC